MVWVYHAFHQKYWLENKFETSGIWKVILPVQLALHIPNTLTIDRILLFFFCTVAHCLWNHP